MQSFQQRKEVQCYKSFQFMDKNDNYTKFSRYLFIYIKKIILGTP